MLNLCFSPDCNMNPVIKVIDGAVMLVDSAGRLWGKVNDLLHSGSRRHNLLKGQPEPGDILLHQEQKRSGFKKFGSVTHVFEYKGGKEITAVVARDNWDDDTGGEPKIISGGPGERDVRVKVTSKFMRGFDHTVYVYGKK